MSNIYSSEATASASHIPMYTGASRGQSFAERARARREAMEASQRLAPPPGLAPPSTSPVAPTRGRRVPSPGMFGIQGPSTGVVLPIAPSLAPSPSIISPSTPSPIPRTPSPPSMTDVSSLYQHPVPALTSSKSRVNEPASYPLPKSTAASSSGSTAEKGNKKVLRKKSVTQVSAPRGAMRTGSTTSTNPSSASFTTSTSASHKERGYGAILNSVPPTSYTYKARNISAPGGRHRSIAPPGLSNIPTPGTAMQRSRSGSGSQSSGTMTGLPMHKIDAQITGSKAGITPPPLTIPAAAAENYTSSPSTANCGSPGMFSYNSTPTSSSTNPSLLQSPGFSPPVQRVRNASPTRPLISKYAGVTAATDKLGKALASKTKDGVETDGVKQTKPASRASLIPANASTTSLSIPKTREAKSSSPDLTSKIALPSKHTRKGSKEILPTKSTLTSGLASHFRRPSKDLAISSAPPSQIGRPSHSRQSSRDSSNVRSPGETSQTSGGYFSTITSPIPIPVPSTSSTSLRTRPPRPSRPDEVEGLVTEVPVIQTSIVAKSKGQKPKLSTSLPRAAGPFGNPNCSTSSVNLASTSVPSKAKSNRVPTPTSATGATVIHGFGSAASSSTTSLPTKVSDGSPRKLQKESRKNSIDKSTGTSLPPPTRPSLFGRNRTKTVPGPAATPAEKEKTTAPKRTIGPGPAAGTGHEGYSSQFSKPSRNRSSSSGAIPTISSKPQTSTVSTPSSSLGRTSGAKALNTADMDDFLQRRLEPVVLRGTQMARSTSSDSASSSLPKLSVRGDSQKSSLDLKRTDSNQGPSSRNPSLDIPRKVSNASEFEKFDFFPNRRPSLAVNTYQTRTSSESPTTAVLSQAPFRAAPEKPTKASPVSKSEEESRVKGTTRKLAHPPVGQTSQSTSRWHHIFSRSKSAPNARENSKNEIAPTKIHSQSPILSQTTNYGNEEAGGFLPDVHSPPASKPVSENPRAVTTKTLNKRAESILLPEPPVMSRIVASRTPSPITAIQSNPPNLPLPKTTGIPSSNISANLIRPPPGLPIPPELQPKISVTEPTPSQSKFPIVHDVRNASPVSAFIPSPASAVNKSGSPRTNGTRPTIASLPSRDTLEQAEKDRKASLTRVYSDDDEEESDEYTDEDDYIPSDEEDSEEEESDEKSAAKSFLTESQTATPVISPPITPKSVTPEPSTNPSPGRRQRLNPVGRIPKTLTSTGPALRIPTLGEILPPPPSLRPQEPQPPQPIKIHPRRMAHPPAEKVHSPSSEGEDDGGEGVDYIDARKIPLNKLPPLITSGWSQPLPSSKRISEVTDDWPEYTDYYVDDMSATTPRSKTPSLGAPFPDFGIFKPDVQDECDPTRRQKDSPTLPSAATFGAVTKFAPSNKKKLVLDQGKLALGRPLAARPIFSPALPTARSSLFGVVAKEPSSQRSSSTYSQRSSGNQKTIAFADFISAYANVDRDVMSVIDPLDKSKHTSAKARKMGLLSPMSSMTDFEDTDSSDSESYRQSIISAMPGTEDALEGEMKVRLWALMTSRWLSFGRVLVSPAHEEIKNAGSTGNRILVIDGLGNDDWSFYCSLNYPNATVYNLTPSPATYPMSPAGNKATSPTGSDDGLNNHHQIHHASFASPFPFPSGFFSVVTFRFLPTTSDSLWPFIISQCMRVLKPGGHLELSVLDIDMVNMGPRTKRTLDEIKTGLRKHQGGNGSDWFKKTPSEKALRLLAKRGFTDITRCRVGLPTVGNVDGSREEQASMQQILREGNSPDEVDMNSAEGINRVVSKVGRWWYTKCFEVPDAAGEPSEPGAYHRSIWEDKTLLRECEKKKTNFRMLISFAKKPTDWRD